MLALVTYPIDPLALTASIYFEKRDMYISLGREGWTNDHSVLHCHYVLSDQERHLVFPICDEALKFFEMMQDDFCAFTRVFKKFFNQESFVNCMKE